jgi:diacylglycerol kinase (ATP)
MAIKRAFLVINPVSGTAQPEIIISRFQAVFSEAGWETEFYQTTGDDPIADIVQRAQLSGFDLFVAAGGDGTISEVGSALAYTNLPLGILPTGTWNALAHNLSIPLLLEDALQLLVHSEHRIQMDALEINGRAYLLNVGIGLSAAVIQSTLRHQKRRFGFLAYIWNVLVQVTGLRLRQIRLGIDGSEVKLAASELMVVNSSILGLGELPTMLDIHPDDGKVEVIAIQAPTLFGLIGVAINFLIGRRKKTPGFSTFSATRKLSIRTHRKVVVQADGEIIGMTPVEIIVRPNAVDVIIP